MEIYCSHHFNAMRKLDFGRSRGRLPKEGRWLMCCPLHQSAAGWRYDGAGPLVENDQECVRCFRAPTRVVALLISSADPHVTGVRFRTKISAAHWSGRR
jgi:hypothetical protein